MTLLFAQLGLLNKVLLHSVEYNYTCVYIQGIPTDFENIIFGLD